MSCSLCHDKDLPVCVHCGHGMAALPSDDELLRRSLNALEGLIEIAAVRSVKPTDVTLTIVDMLRRRVRG